MAAKTSGDSALGVLRIIFFAQIQDWFASRGLARHIRIGRLGRRPANHRLTPYQAALPVRAP